MANFIFYIGILLLFLLYNLSILSIDNLFVLLNLCFTLFVSSKLLSIRKNYLFLINPIFLSSLFMFLLSYGFPVLAEYYDRGIRYGVKYESLVVALIYAIFGFHVLWYSYHSKWLSIFVDKIIPNRLHFRKELSLRKHVVLLFILFTVVINYIDISNGTYGVLSTIYKDDITTSTNQISHFLSLGLKGCVFLLAWQYFKYKQNKLLFTIAFVILIFFQILSGYKGGFVLIFLILFVANYIATNKFNLKLFLSSCISIVLAYAIVNPYRDYLVLTKEHPDSILEILLAIYNGFLLQFIVAKESDVSIVTEVLSRLTTLPELAAFIEYKTKFGLQEPRDPNFLSLCLTIPFQLLIPRVIWPTKPFNDFGVWWVSNTVVGNMSNSSTAFGPIGFLYLAAGILSIIVGFIFVALLLKIDERLMYYKRDGAMLVSIVFLSSLYSMEMGFNVYIMSALRLLFVAYIFQFIIIRRK